MIVAIALSLMVLMVFFNACARYLFNVAFNASEELARYLFIWVIFLGGIEAYRREAYVRITILADALGGEKGRWIMAFAKIIEIIIIIFLFIGGVLYAIQASTYTTAGTNINFAFIASALPIMTGAMLIIEVQEFISRTKNKGKETEL